MLRRKLSQAFEKSFRRRHDAHVAGDGLDDDGGDRTCRLGFEHAWRTESRSLNVCRRASTRRALAGTPGLSGTPIVSAPEPALMRNESPCPW